MRVPGRSARPLLLLFAMLLAGASPEARGYSLLTHEQLIDLTWQRSIVPLLLSRYPTLTPAQLEHARAYAYGGCVIQDIGYYPFGDAFFSDLTHYVRSGDFVVNLFRNAGNADELAFAVGALSHYIGDTVGHARATNRAVPVEFPKLRAKYGDSVSYAEGEHQHVQTEFAFDINEIAHHRLAPVHYLRHVGLEVPTKQLALAFYQTYGLREDFSAGRSRRINVRGYRFATRSFIPRIAYAVTLLHRKQMLRTTPDDTADPDVQRLNQEIQAVGKANDWEQYRREAGIGTRSLAALLFVLPKVGPIRLAAVRGPTPATETDYIHSLTQATDALNAVVRRFTPPPTTHPGAELAAAADSRSQPPPNHPAPANPSAKQDVPRESRDPRHPLPNRDLDTGVPVKPGGYRLTDETYASLLHRIAAHPADAVPPGIKTDILSYYADPASPISTRKKPQQWAAVEHDLATLQGITTSTELDPFPTYGDDSGQ